MSKKLPNFEDLVKYYPAKGSAAEVKSSIGGSVDQEHLHNTCIIRVSKSLNYTGHPIPPDAGWFRTKRGADKNWYGLRVGEFWDYLVKYYGKPTVYKKRADNRIPTRPFSGIRGIIGFRVEGFSDATGHFTLWDGFQLLYGGQDHDYFGIAYEAGLWEAGSTRIFEPEV